MFCVLIFPKARVYTIPKKKKWPVKYSTVYHSKA